MSKITRHIEHLSTLVPHFSRRIAGRYTLAALVIAAVLPPAYRSYCKFMLIPAGGLPTNVVGWIVTLFVRPFALTFPERRRLGTMQEGKEAQTYVDWDAIAALNEGSLGRKGGRPSVPYFLPQRQTTQLPPENGFEQIHQKLEDLLISHSQHTLFATALSVLERRSSALFISPNVPAPSLFESTRGEIFHVHPADCSSHLILSPADAVKTIELGWGERHSLSTKASGDTSVFPDRAIWDRLRRIWRGILPFKLPETYFMVYAPRDDKEVQIVGELVKGVTKYVEASIAV